MLTCSLNKYLSVWTSLKGMADKDMLGPVKDNPDVREQVVAPQLKPNCNDSAVSLILFVETKNINQVNKLFVL